MWQVDVSKRVKYSSRNRYDIGLPPIEYMFDTAASRVLVVGLLLAGHMALMPLFATQPVNPSAGVFPTEDEFTTTPDSYLGETVTSGGIVQTTAPLRIEVHTPTGTDQITIVGTALTPEVGDNVRVQGTLVGPTTIRATRAFVVTQQGLWYTWSISFLAGLWVLARLVRHWTVDSQTLAFHPRDQVYSLRDWRSLTHGGQEGEDA
jgi:hypothetical protein